MAEHLEQELKFSLAGPAEFQQALESLGPPQAILEQCNHYWGAADGQPSPDWVLRLRDEDGQRQLTLKLGRSQQAGYFQSVEIEAVLDEDQSHELRTETTWSETLWELPPLAHLRREFGLDRLAPLGSLRNRRHRCPQEGWVAELDITTFPDGQIDYELEIETDQVELVQRALEPLKPLLTPQTRTKFKRFLERSRGVPGGGAQPPLEQSRGVPGGGAQPPLEHQA